jgi:FAD/FMN-containing dehydrogenase
MEHLDSRYIKAVNYTTKATRSELPKMILLLDISADQQDSLESQIEKSFDIATIKMLHAN